MRPTSLLREGWERVVVCASGPSFTEQQALAIVAARAAGTCRVLVVNDNWRRVPNADVLYACDAPWWEVHIEAIRASGFAGELWTQAEPQARKYELQFVRQVRRPGLTTTERTLHSGGNGGFQAINLAYLFGAERVALVGFDMQRGPGGESHWFGEHAAERLRKNSPYDAWRQHFGDLARDLAKNGVHVVNCSPSSALRCFESADLNAVLDSWRA